jgi:hypothetical protein
METYFTEISISIDKQILHYGKTKYCNDWTRKTPKYKHEKNPVLQVDSSKVSGIHKLYENTTEDSF